MAVYNKWSKIIRAIPYLILSAIVSNSWYYFAFAEYIASWRHYLLLILVLLNAGLYCFQFRPAILLTGVILILCSFYILPPFVEIASAYLLIGPVPLPGIEFWSFLILALFVCLNYRLLIDYYLDWKENRNLSKGSGIQQ